LISLIAQIKILYKVSNIDARVGRFLLPVAACHRVLGARSRGGKARRNRGRLPSCRCSNPETSSICAAA
jgi:hypothetical protein